MHNNLHNKEDFESLKLENKILKAKLRDMEQSADLKSGDNLLPNLYFPDLMVNLPFFSWIRDNNSKYVIINDKNCPDINPHEAIHKSVFEIYPKELAEKYASNDRHILSSGEQTDTIEYYKNKTYRVIQIPLYNSNKQIIGTACFKIDISTEIESNQKLQNEHLMFQALLDNFPYTIYFKDRQSKFTRINKAQAEVLGVEQADDATGTSDFDYFTKNHAEDAFKDEQEIMQTGKPIISKLEKIRNAQGKFRWVSTTKVPTYDENGEINGIVGITVDVTDKRSTEVNLEKALLKAEEADRLKSAFLANMSHDIRTPMNGIVGFADLLRNTNLSKEQNDKYVNHIIKSGNTLLSLIDDIIDISKIEAGQLKIEKKPCKINMVLNEVFELFKNEKRNFPWANFNFVLSKGIEDEHLTIITDPLRFKQILYNLISNAFKFTRKGIVEVGYTQKKKILEFYVKDTGIGVSEDQQDKIFERFGQVEETRKINKRGTGLGLAITTNLVKYLGGDIKLKSKPNEGSVFYFTLPFKLANDDLFDDDFDDVEIKDLNWDEKKILIAEDEDLNYFYLQGALELTKVNLIRAKNGKEAIAMAATYADIDLILMDIKMPVINGYEATKAIKQICPDIPIVAQTAFVMENEKNKCFEAGCDYYLSKPIKKETLIYVINGYFSKD